MNEASCRGASRKVNRHKLDVGSAEESDGNIVPKKSTNKGAVVLAESMEGRTPTKRNSVEEAANRMQSRGYASIGLDRVRQRAEVGKWLGSVVRGFTQDSGSHDRARSIPIPMFVLTLITRGRSRMR